MKVCPKCQKQFSDDANFCPVDAARLVPLETQAPGGDSLTSRFELGDKLGGARTGTVYRAADKQTGAAVVVKTIAPAVVGLPGVAQRLERELKQLERVHSAGVAKVVASGKRGGDAETWIALEMLDGAQTLAEAITARGPIPLAEAAHLIEVIGEALIEAAQVGVVHRDLAPKNILFAGHDIKLINFSLPVPTSERVPGVPEFVAPEQVDGKPVDQRSNLYSLGALYYYVLTGQTVHSGSADEVHRAHASGSASIRTPSSLAPVPVQVEAVIMRALDRSPTKRFLTVRQFVDEVGRVARGESDPRATAPMGRVGRPKAELIQTLLGVRSGAGGVPVLAAPLAAPAQPQLVAATVAGVTTVVSPALAAGGTALGVSANTPTPNHLSAPPMAAAVAVASPASAAAAPSPGIPPDRSPWAPPATSPPGGDAVAATAMPAAAAPAAAAAAPAAAAPAAAAVAAPVVAAPAQGAKAKPSGKKSKPAEGDSKGKFRETLWFKKGELDAQAAEAAADERAKTGRDTGGADKADTLPIDERYKDDGTITRGDKEKYSLRTGGTQMMAKLRDGDAAASSKVSEDALIGEMKAGRAKVFAVIGAAVVVLIVLAIWLLR